MLAIEPSYFEPIIIEDIYVDRLCGIEDASDGNTRYIFGVANHNGIEIKIRVVSGPTLIWHTLRATLRHFGRQCCGAWPSKEDAVH